MKTLLPLLAVFVFADVTPSGCSKSQKPKPPPESKTGSVSTADVQPA